MSKLLSLLIAFAAVVVCLPASAQSIVSLTLDNDTVASGDVARANVNLSAPAPAGGAVVQVFSLSPALFVAGSPTPTSIVVPAGQTTGSFVVATLPVDAAISSFIGASLG